MVALYTRTGDEGKTSLATGRRVPKCSARVEAFGTGDELQAQLGMARALVDDADIAADLLHVEERLYDAMAELADPEGAARVTAEDVAWLEDRIDHYAPERFAFVVPGESEPTAALHVARAVARRAERRAVALAQAEEVSANVLQMLNRISDLCYAMAC